MTSIRAPRAAGPTRSGALDRPLRYPDASSPLFMSRRGWWLVVLNVLMPGLAQVAAGGRRLGRVGILSTFLLWGGVVATVVLALSSRVAILTVATSALGLTVIQVGLAAYGVLWVVLTFDTLRLVRLVKAAPLARPAIAFFSVAVLVVLAGAAGYGVYTAGAARGALGSIFQAGPSVPPVDGRYNVMLLGGDAGEGREGLRPDSMTVVSIDAKTGHAVTIGLPRDLQYAPFSSGPLAEQYPNGYGYNDTCDVDVCQLNSIYSEVQVYKQDLYPDAEQRGSSPGIEAMREALEGITGLTIQYYVLVDMNGFADLVDALGGVDIDVTERLPIGGDENLNNVDAWIEPGEQHMNGYTAQWYARSRHTTSDYDRMARQKELMDAILQQARPVTVATKFQAVARAGDDLVDTDIPQDMVGYFADLGLKTKSSGVTQLELVPPTIDPDDPDYQQIHELIRDALAEGGADDGPDGAED